MEGVAVASTMDVQPHDGRAVHNKQRKVGELAEKFSAGFAHPETFADDSKIREILPHRLLARAHLALLAHLFVARRPCPLPTLPGDPVRALLV